MMESEGEGIQTLELVSTLGFEGSIPGGVVAHPNGQHIVYPLGCNVIIKNIASHEQNFLRGHSNNISCLACSQSGQFLASGQVTHMGFKADVIVWQFSNRSLYCRLTLHKVKVQAIAFSPNDKFLATLGGSDDNSIVIWDIANKEAVCGSLASMQSTGPVLSLSFSKTRDDLLVTGGNKTLRVWELNPVTRKVLPTDCNLGQLKRIINCVQVSHDDQFMYCGTTSGDILQVNIATRLFSQYGPMKDKYSLGVTAIHLLPSGNLLIGTGDGRIVENTGAPHFKRVRSCKVAGGITSIALRGNGSEFYVGTNLSQMFKFQFHDFSTSELIASCHHSAVTDIVFPTESSELFATSSKNDVRVWHTESGKELLRISVPNITCHTINITPDGKAIITGWDDGKIRAYYPESGKPMYTLLDAHNKGVTAMACSSNSRCLISGGGEGQVRVWEILPKKQSMREALKEHKGAVTCIKIRKNDLECITASTDGTCIIWDLVRFVRSQVIFANTMFRTVCYRPDECQIITSGTDRKIGYWEVYDGSQIRELDGSMSDSINGMDIHGKFFITGGGDKLIKVWDYNTGDVTHVGTGHSGDINSVKISPDGRHIVSVSEDGGILRWKYPYNLEDSMGELTLEQN